MPGLSRLVPRSGPGVDMTAPLEYLVRQVAQCPVVQAAFQVPELSTADTPFGHHQGVTDQVQMSKTPGHYDAVLVPGFLLPRIEVTS
jgi:hypothetical protein